VASPVRVRAVTLALLGFAPIARLSVIARVVAVVVAPVLAAALSGFVVSGLAVDVVRLVTQLVVSAEQALAIACTAEVLVLLVLLGIVAVLGLIAFDGPKGTGPLVLALCRRVFARLLEPVLVVVAFDLFALAPAGRFTALFGAGFVGLRGLRVLRTFGASALSAPSTTAAASTLACVSLRLGGLGTLRRRILQRRLDDLVALVERDLFVELFLELGLAFLFLRSRTID
jgi:hypothetical protein